MDLHIEDKRSQLSAKLKEIDSLKVEVEKALAALDKIPKPAPAPPVNEARDVYPHFPRRPFWWFPWEIPPFPRYGDPEIYWCSDDGATLCRVWIN